MKEGESVNVRIHVQYVCPAVLGTATYSFEGIKQFGEKVFFVFLIKLPFYCVIMFQILQAEE